VKENRTPRLLALRTALLQAPNEQPLESYTTFSLLASLALLEGTAAREKGAISWLPYLTLYFLIDSPLLASIVAGLLHRLVPISRDQKAGYLFTRHRVSLSEKRMLQPHRPGRERPYRSVCTEAFFAGSLALGVATGVATYVVESVVALNGLSFAASPLWCLVVVGYRCGKTMGACA